MVAIFRAYLIFRSSSMSGISRSSSSKVRSTALLMITSAARIALATIGGTRQALLGSAPSPQRTIGRYGISHQTTVASAPRCDNGRVQPRYRFLIDDVNAAVQTIVGGDDQHVHARLDLGAVVDHSRRRRSPPA